MNYCPVTGERRPNEENFCGDCGALLVSKLPDNFPFQKEFYKVICIEFNQPTECPNCKKILKVPPFKKFFCNRCGLKIFNEWRIGGYLR